MSKIQPYIKIPRELFKTDRARKKPYDKFHAELDLYNLANFKDNTIHKRGIPIELKPGQVGWSMVGLADRWGWSEQKVKRYLKCLENEGQITLQTSRVSSKITLLNYIKNEGQNDRKTTDKQPNKQPTEYKPINGYINERERALTKSSQLESVKDSFTDLQVKFPDVELETEYEKFTDWMSATGRQYKDYTAGFRNWLRRVDTFDGKQKSAVEFDKTPLGDWKAWCSKCGTLLFYKKSPYPNTYSECCSADILNKKTD